MHIVKPKRQIPSQNVKIFKEGSFNTKHGKRDSLSNVGLKGGNFARFDYI